MRRLMQSAESLAHPLHRLIRRQHILMLLRSLRRMFGAARSRSQRWVWRTTGSRQVGWRLQLIVMEAMQSLQQRRRSRGRTVRLLRSVAGQLL